MSAHTEFDLGSLVWVKSEIEQTLQKAAEALTRFSESQDTALLKHARTFLHQAYGAVQMVELSGLARFCEEIEQTLAADPMAPEALDILQRAIAEASHYLEQLSAGALNQPLRLLPVFQKMAALRQASGSGAELFFPQLSELDLPKGLPAKTLPPENMSGFIRLRRQRFEAALLSWISKDPAAAAVMAKNLAEIAATQSVSMARHFWWAAAGFMDGLSRHRGSADIDFKALVLRINLQLHRLSEGSGKVAERLYRDILYALLVLETTSPLALALRKAFALESLLPASEADLMSPAAKVRNLLARSLREEMAGCKELWSRICSGQSERLTVFGADFERMVERSAPLDIPGLPHLWDALRQTVKHLGINAPGDGEALEVATALLLIDNGLAIYPLLADDFPEQVEAMCQRLLNPALNSEVPHLDAVSRQAQERLLQAQLAHEMRSNLQMVEDVLDGWFRNPDQSSELKKIDPSLRQIQGALGMLEKKQASQLLQLCQSKIEQFMHSELLLPAQNELEQLAEGLSCLGFYIDCIAQGRDEPASLAAMIDRLSGSAPAETAVEEAACLLEEEPVAADVIVPAKPVPDPGKPLPVSDAAADAELLEVFLEEAAEVLASIAAELLVCQQSPHDRDALTVLRRSFHTLKGSGRMVGLNHLAEVAWSVEQLMNKLMQVERPASAELLQLLNQSHTAFSTWVEQLFSTGTAQVEASDLIASAERLKAQLDAAPVAVHEQISLSVEDEKSDSDEIMIGTVAVSSSLFALFCNEATQYLHTLQAGKESEPSAYLLAAHTLGGIASTAGFRSLGELAYTLEHAVQQLGERVIGTEPVLDQAVERIGTMLGSIFALEAPGFAEAEILALQNLRSESFEISLDEEEHHLPDSGLTDIDLDHHLAEPVLAEETDIFLEEELPVSHEHESDLHEFEALPDTASVPEFVVEALAEPELAPEVSPEVAAAEVPVEELAEELAAEPEAVAESELAPEVSPEFAAAEFAVEELAEELAAEPEAVAELELAPEVSPEFAAAEFAVEELAEELAAEPEAVAEPELAPEVSPEVAAAEVTVEELAEKLAVVPEAVAEPELVVDAIAEPLVGVDMAEAIPAPHSEVIAELDDELDIELSPLEQLLDKHEDVPAFEGLQADDIDEQLLPVFMEEADELIQQISASLRGLRISSLDEKEAQSLSRVLHTFKGSARMAGAMRMGEVTHQMESRLLAAGHHYSTSLLDALDADFDLLQTLADELKGVKKPVQLVVPAQAPLQTDADTSTTIRVKSELMDQLVNQAGEVSIARSRIEAEMITLKSSLLDLTENVNRLRSQLRELEIQAESQMQAKIKDQEGDEANFDPLEFDRFTRLQEVTRFIAESVNDVATIQHNLLKNHDDSTAALTQQARMTKELQQSLMRVRMVPFSSLADRLYRLTRQTGKEVGKKVNLELRGGRVEIDRGVLDQMMSPFEHMLRNAIDHGLESTEQRLALGKPEFGEVLVEVRQEGNELVLILKDDGQGLNLDSLRAKGVEKGLISADASDQLVTGLIFEPGITTASALTTLSGRGIGMDVVKNKLSDLGGRIDVTSQAGVGTTFTIYLPLTLAVTQVVLVRAGGQQYAIPSGMIEQVQEIKLAALERIYENRYQEWMDHQYPFAYFPRLLGDAQTVPEQKRYNTVMLLRSGTGRMALHVDELVRNLEVVVKTIGPQLARIPGVTGATVLGNGDIVMIMNPLTLLSRGETRGAEVNIAPEILKTTPVVMVVDDSLTVRKITGRLLAREGFQVMTAKDGVDALQQLSDIQPDVMLVDIEMPRMDGFEFTRNVRANEGTRHIPIIMITSRTADKHKNYAFELGVNAFLGKPYQEEELLAQIRGFIQS